jgi:hypothetical protein
MLISIEYLDNESGKTHNTIETTLDELTEPLMRHFTTERVLLFRHEVYDEGTATLQLANGIKVRITKVADDG